MTRYIFITGGVVSSLGKGIAAASLGAILEARGLDVTLIKLDPAERLRQTSLARTTSPDLSENASMGERKLARQLSRLEAYPHRSLVPLEGNQRATVEDEAHADCALRETCRPRPRTTVASARSARRWAAISSALISPNSCSKSATAAASSDSL